jgi:type IV pilus assembly protein PilW
MCGAGGVAMKRPERGFSLVELMVALVLGLLITAAAVQLFTTNHRTFQLQQTVSGVQEDGQLLLRFLISDLRRTGLVMEDVTPTRAMGVQLTSYTVAGGRTFPASTEGTDSDRLTIGFNGTEDCEGDTVTSATEVINTYYLDDGALHCEGSLNGGTTGVELLPGVEAFEVLYGIDSSKDGVLRVDRYVNKGAVGTNPVVSVRVGILLSQTNQVLPKADGSKSFYVLNKKVDEPEDRSIRRMFTTTVQLRNYDWDGV